MAERSTEHSSSAPVPAPAPDGGGQGALADPLIGQQPVHITDDGRVIRLLQAMLRHNTEQLEELARSQDAANRRADTADQRAQQAVSNAQRFKTDADLAEQRRAEADRRERVAAERATSAVDDVAEVTRARDALAAEVSGLKGTLESLRATLAGTQQSLQTAEADAAALDAAAPDVDALQDAHRETIVQLEKSLAETEQTLHGYQEREADLTSAARKAEEARDRAQQGTTSFQQMVEEARGKALGAERASESAAERVAELEATAAACTDRAEAAERLVAELDLELTERAGVDETSTADGNSTTRQLQDELARTRAELTRLRAEADASQRVATSSRALATATEAERARLFNLSDAQRLRELIARAEDLWPATPDRIEAYEDWLAGAEGLVLMLEEHRLTLRTLRRLDELLTDDERDRGWAMPPDGWDTLRAAVEEDAADTTDEAALRAQVIMAPGTRSDDEAPAVRTWVSMDLHWWRDTLDELVTAIDRLARPADGLLTDVEQRLETARTIDAKSLTGKAVARAWKDARDDIADSERCPAYGGLHLAPQLGLRPVGKDGASGLWEFAMPHTGTVPQRRADGQLALDDDHAIVVVLIPGGTAQLGAQAGDRGTPHHDLLARRNEGPVHEVALKPFFLSKYAMTQAQWERAMRSNPSRYPPGMRIGGVEQTARHPVENVSWNECREALRRLGLVLPTEAQWEYAARAGTGTPWWTGDQRDSLVGAVNLGDQAARRGGATWAAIQDWLELDDGYTVHAPVDYDRANPFGLHGVHGNVWEWCRDALVAYDVEPATGDGDGLRTQSGSTTRVFRGGGFRNTAAQSRVSSRLGDVPEKRSSDLGLRPARAVDDLAAD